MYYLELSKFPSAVLTDDYVRPVTDSGLPKYWHVKPEFLKPEIVDIFSGLNLELHDMEIFRKPPGSIGAVHTDVIYNNTTNTWEPWNCAVNINIDCTESVMYWFSTHLPEVLPKVITARLNGIHYGSEMNNNKFHGTRDFTILDSLKITKPTLVRTNAIHSVENIDNKDRWCISIRFKGNPTFEECASKLAIFC